MAAKVHIFYFKLIWQLQVSMTISACSLQKTVHIVSFKYG